MRLKDYRGHQIWQYPSGLFHAFDGDQQVGTPRDSLSAIHKVVDRKIEESQ